MEVEIGEAEIEHRLGCATTLVEEVNEIVGIGFVSEALFSPGSAEEVAPICLALKVKSLVQSEVGFEGTLLEIEITLGLLFCHRCGWLRGF